MRKLYKICFIFSFIVLLLTGCFTWLLVTNQGAKFVINKVIQFIPADVQISSINGNIVRGLEVKNPTVRLMSWEITAKRFYVRWNPFHILGGWIGVQVIGIEELSLNDLFPEVRNPHDLTWPKVKGILSWTKARVKLLYITSISYKEAGREIQRIDGLSAQLIWYLGRLNIRSFYAKIAGGVVDGSARANFTSPNFSAKFFMKSTRPYLGLDEYRFILNLKAASRPLQMSGPMTIIGMSKNNEHVKLVGTVAISKKIISLDRIDFKEMGRPGSISGNVSLDLSVAERPYELNLSLNDIDLLKNKEAMACISGILAAKGNISGYSGSFSIKNIAESWKNLTLEGQLKGNNQELKIFEIKGRALKGSVTGKITASWSHALKVSGMLNARNLDPALITPDWPGIVNADFSSELTFTRSSYPEGQVKANFLRSTVRNRPLTGNIEVQWAKGLLSVDQAELHGKGFDVKAHGILQRKVDYNAKITDLGGLIPSATGRLTASGWFRWANDRWGGIVTAEGYTIGIGGLKADSALVSIKVNEKEGDVLKANLQAGNVNYGPINLRSALVTIGGKLSNHDVFISLKGPKSNGEIAASGGYHEGEWSGTLSKMEGWDALAGVFNVLRPVALNISRDRAAMTPMILSGASGELAEISGALTFNPIRGSFSIRWEKLRLERANQIYGGIKIGGTGSGFLQGQIFDKERMRLVGSGTNTFSIARGPITLRGSTVSKIDCGENGIRASFDVGFANGGKFESQFVSNEPAYLRMPESGEMRAMWRDIDVTILKPLSPHDIDITGKVSGTVQGRISAGSHFEISGKTDVTDSSITWKGEGGAITSTAEYASVHFNWKDEVLKGRVDVKFPSHGKVNGNFNLPVSAHFPVKIARTSAVNMQLSGEIREKGIISSIFPGLVEESKGHLIFDVTRKGTWDMPDVEGQIKLRDATAYLPGTGIRVEGVTANATFVQDRIELRSFTGKSGSGKLEGSGTFWFKGFGIARFKTLLTGEGFQTIYLPELQVSISPDLIIEGEGDKMMIKGKILIPDALLRDVGNKTSVRTSDDVVIVDAPRKEKKPLKSDIEVQVSVVMGKKVHVQVLGLDGQIQGNVNLTGRLPDKLLGKGMLKIAGGKYNSYGIKLDVVRGNIMFDNKPVDLALLDIMAIRTFNPGKFDEIKAGVTVTGTPLSPLIKLYSDPPMTDTDVLSYLVLGRPTKAGAETQQTALLLKSASAVLGVSKSGGIQDQIQHLLGVDTLEVQEGANRSFTTSRTSTVTGSTLNNSLMTVGKYLSPDLYISYGRSLFSDQYLVSARYSLSKKLELESKAGMETSVDLFYKIEFD